MEDVVSTLLIMYFLIIPFIYNTMWQDNKNNKSFIKWYFTKSECVNWLGFLVFILLGLGSFIYVLLYYIAEAMFYIIFIPLEWVFKFLFLKKCNKIDSDK